MSSVPSGPNTSTGSGRPRNQPVSQRSGNPTVWSECRWVRNTASMSFSGYPPAPAAGSHRVRNRTAAPVTRFHQGTGAESLDRRQRTTGAQQRDPDAVEGASGRGNECRQQRDAHDGGGASAAIGRWKAAMVAGNEARRRSRRASELAQRFLVNVDGLPGSPFAQDLRDNICGCIRIRPAAPIASACRRRRGTQFKTPNERNKTNGSAKDRTIAAGGRPGSRAICRLAGVGRGRRQRDDDRHSGRQEVGKGRQDHALRHARHVHLRRSRPSPDPTSFVFVCRPLTGFHRTNSPTIVSSPS